MDGAGTGVSAIKRDESRRGHRIDGGHPVNKGRLEDAAETDVDNRGSVRNLGVGRMPRRAASVEIAHTDKARDVGHSDRVAV
jgi:hypothetical protein